MGRTQRLAQPEAFAKYQLVARLAHGHMGDVYKAKSLGVEGFEKILCVKVIHPGFAAAPDFVNILIEEAKRAVALSHANIAQVLDLGREEQRQQFYVAVEYINGMDLARALKLSRASGQRWSQEMSVFIASEVAKGLDYAHRRKDFNFNNLNILHRSLRPENVMLSYDGEVKITDFGLSRAMALIEPIDDHDVLKRVLYASPEVMRGEPHTRQSDIFGLGLMLYEMLAGAHPYAHPDIEEVRRRARAAQIPAVSESLELPRPLQQILESMLVPDPSGRAQSAGQLYEELIGYLFGNNLQADNRLLSMAMQELRRREQESATDEPIQEVGLEEISVHELESAFARGGAFHPSAPLERAAQGLPTSRLGGRDAAHQAPPLPGALESLLRSAHRGRGKAALLAGGLGRGPQHLLDRLAQATARRSETTSYLLVIGDDDRLRPFGALSEMLLACLAGPPAAGAPERRRIAIDTLRDLGVSRAATETLQRLWQLGQGTDSGWETRRAHLVEILTAFIGHQAAGGTFVWLIDHIEALDLPSLDVLRDLVASIGAWPVLLIMGTASEDTMRSHFNAGPPENLEAVRVRGPGPLSPEELSQANPAADALMSVLALAERPLPAADLPGITAMPARDIEQAAASLLELGALRQPLPDHYHLAVPNWLTWRLGEQGSRDIDRRAAALARYLCQRVAPGEQGGITPTLIRLYAFAQDRRALLALAARFGDWLQRHAWQRTALGYYRHLAGLLGAHALGVPQTRVDLLLQAAELALELAMIEECRDILNPLSALTEATRYESGFARSQLLLGQLAMQQDDLDEARGHFNRAWRTACGLEHPELIARASLAMAGWYERFGDPAAALERVESAVNLYARWDAGRTEPRARAALLQRSAQMWGERGMNRRALAPLQDLDELARAHTLPAIRCRALIARGRLAGFQGQIDSARELLDQALSFAAAHGLQALVIEIRRIRISVELHAGDYALAMHWADEAARLAGRHDDRYSEQRAHDLRALAMCYLGQEPDEAVTLLRQSLRRATERGVPKDVYRGHDFLAQALSALGRDAEAAHHQHHALDLARSVRPARAL
ncbi:hypothetical protein DL240_07660 [Lujinxingia litoralis]|uniref:non-specific serine/threonine protein kinase n=1 Tax=Lujinxingia litoralis TaxID=2211119 RepID=A0A328CBD1_9DELT|nr:protein kinase [Lujinxingia litoralis]RAL22767.1 hypothetical protein DL240_07660 [Lujinxingia litoralis]